MLQQQNRKGCINEGFVSSNIHLALSSHGTDKEPDKENEKVWKTLWKISKEIYQNKINMDLREIRSDMNFIELAQDKNRLWVFLYKKEFIDQMNIYQLLITTLHSALS
jgi:hypothetical protein